MQPDFFLQFHICEVTIEIVNIKIKTSFNIPRNLWDKNNNIILPKTIYILSSQFNCATEQVLSLWDQYRIYKTR